MTSIVRQTRIGAYVVCVRDGALLLARFTDSERWTLPGGGLDHGEDPRDGAVREVAEETGYRIALGPLIGVDSVRWDQARDGHAVDLHAVHLFFTGEVVGGDLRHEVRGSTDRAQWVPLREVAALDRSHLIDAALDAAGLS